jgi:3-phosphoglycerate kinase
MNKLPIRDIDLNGKTVLLRLDLNVPVEGGRISNDARIRESLPTLEYISQRAGCAIMSHLGRPKGRDTSLSLRPVAERLSSLLSRSVRFVDDCLAPLDKLERGEVVLLENLRFYREEEANDREFARKLAAGKDVYVNDGFGVSHRAHASVHAVAQFFENPCAGFLMEKEISNLGKLLHSPERPFVTVLGGAKVSDKILLIENLLKRVDRLLVGGAMSYTFLKSLGREIGNSLVEMDRLDVAKGLVSSGKIILPVDHVLEDGSVVGDIPPGGRAFDIGPRSVSLFKEELGRAGTILCNGPVGMFEKVPYENGTRGVFSVIASLNCMKVAGGGDTASAIEKFGLKAGFTHVSTGGGACVEFLEGKELPGIAVLKDK